MTSLSGKLVSDLRGLYVEADPHDPSVRANFESAWSSLDAEYELRTETWASVGRRQRRSAAGGARRPSLLREQRPLGRPASEHR
jgi:hypothetical protein